MISERRDCEGGKSATELHGGVCQRTPTQHKSRTKIKTMHKTRKTEKKIGSAPITLSATHF